MMWSCKRLSFLRHLLPYICKLHLRVLELFSLLYMLQNHHKTVKKKKKVVTDYKQGPLLPSIISKSTISCCRLSQKQ